MWKLYCLKTHADIPKRRIKRYFANFICFFISLKFCKKLLKAAYSFFNNFQTKYITCFPGIYGREKETHKYDTIFPLSKVSFEGNNYWAPGNWDTYLKEKYDNYMELPPVEQQIAHQPNFISFGDGCINKEN
jgi:lipopolysaccharide cholinephosphotransferase